MDKQQLDEIRARDADDYAAADVLRNIRSAGNTDPELEATINMIADRHALLSAYDALRSRLAEVHKTLAPLVDDDNRPVEALARYAVARIAEAEARWLLNHAVTRDTVEEWTRRRDAFLAGDQSG